VNIDEEISDDEGDQSVIQSQARLDDEEKQFLTGTKQLGFLGKDPKGHHAREVDSFSKKNAQEQPRVIFNKDQTTARDKSTEKLNADINVLSGDSTDSMAETENWKKELEQLRGEVVGHLI
jgi:hypothetical protein